MPGKRPFQGTSGSEAPLAEHLATDMKWLVNDINRRISISVDVPRFHYSRSGTASSGYLTNHLIDLSGDESSVQFIVDEIRSKVSAELLEEGE